MLKPGRIDELVKLIVRALQENDMAAFEMYDIQHRELSNRHKYDLVASATERKRPTDEFHYFEKDTLNHLKAKRVMTKRQLAKWHKEEMRLRPKLEALQERIAFNQRRQIALEAFIRIKDAQNKLPKSKAALPTTGAGGAVSPVPIEQSGDSGTV
jgi:hypothetical protein